MFSSFFFCMVHGDRSKGSTFLEMAEDGRGKGYVTVRY